MLTVTKGSVIRAMLSNIVRVVLSNIFLVFRIIIGNRIKFSLISLISPFAIISTNDKGTIVFGKKCAIRSNTVVTANGSSIKFGNNCFINRNCMIVAHDGIVFGDNVTIGPGCYVFDHDHGENGTYVSKSIVLEDNVWIGAGSIVLKGVTIGHDSVIAAGSVITKDIAPYSRIIQRRV